MRNYIALALIAASTSAVMLRNDDATIEAAVTEVAAAAGCTKGEVRDQVKERIEGADGDVEKAVKEAKAEFDGEKPAKGSKPAKNEDAQQEADTADVEKMVEKVAEKIENGEEPSEEDKENLRKAAKKAGASDKDIDEAVKMIEDGDVEGLEKKAKKCHKGGESKPEETTEAQEDAESTDDKPAKGDRPAKESGEAADDKAAKGTEEGDRPAKEDGESDDEDKPRRHRKCLAEAAGELADELNLTEGEKIELWEAFYEQDWEAFEEGADIVGDENAEKLFNKLDGAEMDFEADEAERPAKEDRPSKDGEAPAKEE